MRALRIFGSLVSDLLYLAGGGLVVHGVCLVYVPAGFMAAGLLAISLGLIIARHRARGGGG